MTVATVVIPTRNSASTLGACLSSINAQRNATLEVIVVDNGSTDATVAIAEHHGVTVLHAGPERSAQRNVGGRAASGEVLLFIDSDMSLQPDVVSEAVARVGSGAHQVVIPEQSFGTGFWAQVKAFERSLYLGDDSIEAARAFPRAVWMSVGGYDESIVAGPEDWDIDQRVRELGGYRSRTDAMILHDEGELTLAETMRTKYYYGKSAAAYLLRHSSSNPSQLSPVRPAFLRERRKLAGNPLLASAMVVMKVCELSAGAAGLVVAEGRRRSKKLRVART